MRDVLEFLVLQIAWGLPLVAAIAGGVLGRGFALSRGLDAGWWTGAGAVTGLLTVQIGAAVLL